MTLRVLDLFAGLGGWSEAARDRGHDVRTLDLDPRFGTDYVVDIRDVTPSLFGDWRPDLVLASPPCEAFSVLRIGRNWTRAGGPRTDKASLAVDLVIATLDLVEALEPAWWIMENPRGKLRRLPVVHDLERRTVTYCQFGGPTQKPTDLWGGFPPALALPAPCRPRASCHISSPRGSKDGIQGSSLALMWYRDTALHGTQSKRDLAALRAKVPYRLGEMVVEAAERGGARAALPHPTLVLQSAIWPAVDVRA